MAAVLRNVGFDVVEGTNLTRDKMTEKLLDFGKKAQGADVAVFFYAGHGIAISGTNYLLPIDADIKSEMDVKLGAAINIDLTLDQTMSDAKVKLVFLDACRDNPFAAKIKSNSATRSVSVQTGLAEMKSGEGTLIAFATGPGQTALDGQEGTNSPFTRALIANITQPGVEIQQAMTKVRAQVNEETNKGQLPWGHTNLIGSVYLNGAPPRRRPPRPRRPAPAAVASTSGGSDVEARVLALDQGLQQAGRAQRLSDQLSQRPVQVAGAGPDRLAGERPEHHDPQPDHRRRSRDLQRRSQPDHRRPDRPRQGPAPRRAAPAHRARLRHQGHRQVRRTDPRRDHALAGRPRLSQDRLPQQAAAQGAADRDRRPRRRPVPATTPTTRPAVAAAVAVAVVAAAVIIAAAAAAPAASSAAWSAACSAETRAGSHSSKKPGSCPGFFDSCSTSDAAVPADGYVYFPAALRSASLMRSCQPGPPS